MSKAKKDAYAAKQQAAAAAAREPSLTPLGEKPAAEPARKSKPKKQSRGK
jgi:hypothetical protein